MRNKVSKATLLVTGCIVMASSQYANLENEYVFHINNKEELELAFSTRTDKTAESARERANKEKVLAERKRMEIAKRKLEAERKRAAERAMFVTRGGRVSAKPIYDPNDIRIKSQITKGEMDKVLNGTGLEGTSVAFIKAEEDYGVNAIFLASLSILESGAGTSKMARTKNNIFGFQAYDYNTGKAKMFESYGHSIDHVSRYIGKNYLTEGGKHFNGYSIYDINKKYCSQSDWSGKINQISRRFVNIE